MRDRLPQLGRLFHPGVNQFYRTVVIRLTQQQRRERLDRAVTIALKKRLIADEYMDKMRYSRRCTQAWKLRREHLLDNLSKGTKTGRRTMAEREEVLQDFWKQVDEEINNGEVPRP